RLFPRGGPKHLPRASRPDRQRPDVRLPGTLLLTRIKEGMRAEGGIRNDRYGFYSSLADYSSGFRPPPFFLIPPSALRPHPSPLFPLPSPFHLQSRPLFCTIPPSVDRLRYKGRVSYADRLVDYRDSVGVNSYGHYVYAFGGRIVVSRRAPL